MLPGSDRDGDGPGPVLPQARGPVCCSLLLNAPDVILLLCAVSSLAVDNFVPLCCQHVALVLAHLFRYLFDGLGEFLCNVFIFGMRNIRVCQDGVVCEWRECSKCLEFHIFVSL
jgi:hypothetical protein